MFLHADGRIYSLQASLSELVLLSKLSPLGGIALSVLVLLIELSKDVISQIPIVKT